MLLRDALTGYRLVKRPALSPPAVTDYELAFERIVELVGEDRTIESVTRDDVRRFLAAMRDEHDLSTKSVINL